MPVARLVAVPAFEDNYIWIAADGGGDAIAVDPGDATPVRDALARHRWRLRAILLTHHHGDHIGGAAELAAETGAEVHAPVDDRIDLPCRRAADDDRIAIGAFAFEVLAVPGHTRSHIAFHGEGLLFCGDTLFSLGCGRLFEGTPEQMLASLDRLAALPGDTRVCCGHEYTLSNAAFALSVDPDNAALREHVQWAQVRRTQGEPTLPSTIDIERAANPFLRVDSPALVAALGDRPRVDRFAELRRRKDTFRAPPA